MLSTSFNDPWVPSLISSYNGTSPVDVILTADPNLNLTTWESPVGHLSLIRLWLPCLDGVYGGHPSSLPLLLQVFILFFRVLVPLLAIWTVWLGVTYMQEIRTAKEWRWRLSHLIMIVEIPAMTILALTCMSGLYTDDWTPIWVFCSFVHGLPYAGFCTTIFMGLFWRYAESRSYCVCINFASPTLPILTSALLYHRPPRSRWYTCGVAN